jgi:hypothetical protein
LTTLTLSPGSFDVSALMQAPNPRNAIVVAEVSGPWSFLRFFPYPSFTSALCVEGRDVSLSCWHWPGMDGPAVHS